MPDELDYSVFRLDDGDVHIIVPTEVAESVYEAFRATGVSATFPRPSMFRTVSLRRGRGGKVEQIEEPIESVIDASDPDDRVDALIQEWFEKQG
jgi:hypothetical protein